MKLFFLSLFLCTYAHSTLNGYFCENIQDTNLIQVFIQPENIEVTKDGIYLGLEDGQSLPLPNLQSNNQGLFTTLNSTDAVRYATYTCPGCGATYYWWENCNNPGCPKNPKG